MSALAPAAALGIKLTASRGIGPWVALMFAGVMVVAAVYGAIRIRRYPLLARDKVR